MADTNKNKGGTGTQHDGGNQGQGQQTQGSQGGHGNQGGGQGQGGQNKGGQGQGGGTSTMGGVAETARNIAGQAGQAATSAMSGLKDQAGNAGAAVASGMSNLAGTIREHVPGQGMLGSVGSTVADSLESSGQYLSEHGLGDIASDVSTLVRRNPIPAMLICVGIGFCLGSLMSSSSRS